MPAALDTNLLVYEAGVNFTEADAGKAVRARQLLRSLPQDEIRIPVQVAGELYRVLTVKAGWSPARAREIAGSWITLYAAVDTNAATLAAAFDLSADHRLSIWDAVIMASAAVAGCDMLLTEDLQHGFAWRGVTVVNPFAARTHPLLARMLRRSRGG